MTKLILIASVAIIFGGWFCLASSSHVLAQQARVQPSVTLYSALKYGDEQHKNCLNLATGTLEAANSNHQPCHLDYGFMSAGNELDWFRTVVTDGDRSVIKDLGELGWTSRFEIPVMAALPKLAPGEHREIRVGGSAAAEAPRTGYGYGAGDLQRHSLLAGSDSGPGTSTPRKNKENPGIDPPFIIAKASLGHLYVVHVVDDVSDFYALVRVDAVEKGDHCTISWRLIPAPEPKASRKK